VRDSQEIVAILANAAKGAIDTRSSAESMLATSKAVEAAAVDLRAEVEGFLQRVAI
jgi:hypothetical protein